MSEGLTEVSLEGGPKQPYHLLHPDPMPLLSAISAGTMMTGAILALHTTFPWLFFIGLAMVLACMFFWWKKVIHESVVEKAHGPVVKLGLRYGMSLFIASEVMFFVAFFWAFFSQSLFPNAGIKIGRAHV